jgi:tetratricopeptide (TPR) repeat protein
VKLPKSQRANETVDAPVGLCDIAPTIAQLTGVTLPGPVDGRSLLSAPGSNRRIYSESLYPRIHLGWSELRSLEDAQYHYIEAPKPELYDMKRDPKERTNALAEERRVYAAMRQELEKYDKSIDAPGQIDPEEAKKLAALGYLSSPASAPGGPLPDPKDRIHEITAMIRASDLLRERRFDAAIAAFREIVRQNPRFTDAWNQLGSALESAGRIEEADSVYRTIIETSPDLAGEFALRRGSVLLKLERYDEAERHARLAEGTNASAMHLLLARIAFARKNFTLAESEAKRAAEDRSQRIGAELVLAQIYAQQGRANDAWPIVQRVEQEIAAENTGPIESMYFVRGDVLARMEKYDEAIAAFRREIDLFPANRQTYANLYLVYKVTGRDADAERALEDMARAIPSKETLLFAARTAGVLGDEEIARMWRRRANAK